MKGDTYILARPSTPEQWQAYHDIRRKILWENRGLFGIYDENYPDEFLPDNHPMLLFLQEEPIGVARIDIIKNENRAIMRRVAIKESGQRKGHGRKLVELVEQFARDRGVKLMTVSASAGAVEFYRKCGYRELEEIRQSKLSGYVEMTKQLIST